MDAPTILYALRWLIYDTFWQALTSRVFWILLGLSGICIVFCLGVSVVGGVEREDRELFAPDGKPLGAGNQRIGQASLLFGVFTYEISRDAEREIKFFLNIFGSFVGGILGVLFTLVFTAGFIPDSLQPSAASVLLAKPIPRWLFLMGKFVGVVSFVALHAVIFYGGTWLALGLTTNYWHPTYLFGILFMVFHFTTIFSFTLILAVLFRSSTAGIVGALAFWGICAAVNWGRHSVVVFDELNPGAQMSTHTTLFSEISYWCLPKPIDFTIMLQETLGVSADVSGTLAESNPFKPMIARNYFHPIPAMLSSFFFTAFALWTSASQLAKTDY